MKKYWKPEEPSLTSKRRSINPSQVGNKETYARVKKREKIRHYGYYSYNKSNYNGYSGNPKKSEKK